VVEGVRDIERAIASGLEPLEVYYDAGRYESSPFSAPIVVSVEGSALDRASYRAQSQGVIAVFAQFAVSLDDLQVGDNPILMVAEGIEKPGNLGAMLRTADAVGCEALIAADTSTDPFNPNVVRASMGALFTVPLAVAALEPAVTWLGDRGIRVVAAHPDAEATLWEIDLTGPVAILVGSEHEGLTSAALRSADVTVSIPMTGHTDSLNASVSAALLAYEALRQRSAHGR
jgi:TrmH family RNA methyltransferase